MRAWGWLLAGAAVAGSAVSSRAELARAVPDTGQCRRAAPLPPLPPESERAVFEQPADRAAPAAPVMESAAPLARITAGSRAAPPPPPPPPVPVPVPPPSLAEPAPSVADSDESDSIVVTGTIAGSATRGFRPSRSAPAAKSGPSASSAFERRRGEPEPEAGLLTAGEHDDLLNPELYARYVAAFLQGEPLAGVPRVDTARVLTVAVRDASGQAVPFAPVTLTCADGNTLTLPTLADGQAVFFPDLDRLGREVRVGVPGGGGPRRVVLPPGAGGVTQSIIAALPARPVRALDLALVVDVTGSMGDELTYLQTELRAILADLRERHPGLDLRVALIAYRDRGDEFVTHTFAFTDDVMRVQTDLAAQRAGGGGDEPEAVEAAMARAAALPWRARAVKSLFLVADAPPHADDVAATWAAAELLRAKRVQIVPVAASGVERGAEYVMRAMAAATQSRYLFLTDDSGIGNTHAAPAIDCYQVTKLADAMARVLDSQLSGRRIEAPLASVIRTVGTYDAGRCVLPRGWERRQ